jgi:hypothetical protein
MSETVTEPRNSRWPVIVAGLVAFAVLLIIQLNTMNSEERYRYEQWKSTVLPCAFNPNTGEPLALPCRSGDKIYTK